MNLLRNLRLVEDQMAAFMGDCKPLAVGMMECVDAERLGCSGAR